MNAPHNSWHPVFATHFRQPWDERLFRAWFGYPWLWPLQRNEDAMNDHGWMRLQWEKVS